VWISITEVAKRSGIAASALRFYESEGLVVGSRSASGRRQYPREALRRVAFILAAQRVGLSLNEIREALAALPAKRTPTVEDWARLSKTWKPLVEARITAMVQLRDQLTSCIGCGCLSLKKCALYNPDDAAATRGSGARFLLGDRSDDIVQSSPTRR
jgi:MerR family transcriptional regulator, redox-sensitive transcriptional activator SoxR